MSRRWRHGGREYHHVIDPTTGTTSTTDLLAVTVIANAGWLAEAHATAALLSGSIGAVPYIEAHGLAAIVTERDGTIRTSGLDGLTLEGTR